MNCSDKMTLARHILYEFRKAHGMRVEIKIRSAVRTLVDGVVVGIPAEGRRLLIFRQEDYYPGGILRGGYDDVSSIAGEDGFHLLSQSYDDQALKMLGHTRAEVDKLMDRARRFSDSRRRERDRSR